jgi:hypothetical protein
MAFLAFMFLIKDELTAAQFYSFTVIGGVAGLSEFALSMKGMFTDFVAKLK